MAIAPWALPVTAIPVPELLPVPVVLELLLDAGVEVDKSVPPVVVGVISVTAVPAGEGVLLPPEEVPFPAQ